MEDYHIAFGNSALNLSKAVREYLKDGYVPWGSIAINPNGILYQPMVKYGNNQNDLKEERLYLKER